MNKAVEFCSPVIGHLSEISNTNLGPSVLGPAYTMNAVVTLKELFINMVTVDFSVIFQIDVLKIPDVCLGFEVRDTYVQAAAVALRLLNVGEMRRLQNEANFAIVQVQRLTADPKTDEKLGQVGF